MPNADNNQPPGRAPPPGTPIPARGAKIRPRGSPARLWRMPRDPRRASRGETMPVLSFPSAAL